MTSTGYEPLNRRPGGDGVHSNGGTKSSGKAMHKSTLPVGSSGSLKSSASGRKDGSSSARNSKKLLHMADMPGSSKSEVLFHPATPSSKPGVRKASPVDEVDLTLLVPAQRIDMDRRVRQRPHQSSPYELIHLDPHAEYTHVPMHVKMNQNRGSKTLPNLKIVNKRFRFKCSL